LNEKGLDSLKGQKQGVDDQVEMLKMALGQRNGLDLSPLMALTDSWTGSNLQKGYTKPDADKIQAGVQSMTQAIQKGRNDLSQNEIDLLKSQLGIAAHKQEAEQRAADRALQLKMHQDQLADSAANRKAMTDTKNLVHAQDKFNGDSNVSKVVGSLHEAEETDKKLDEGLTNPVVAQAIPLYLAKMAVSGRLNETEINMQGGSQAFANRMEKLAKRIEGEGLTQTDYAYMKRLVKMTRDGAAQEYHQLLDKHAGQYAQSAKVSKDEAKDLLSGGYLPSLGDSPSTAPNAGEVVDGYKFKGGNPADPNSWEKS
jgi:hypothetical protein